MKRKLTDKEKELTEKGIKRVSEELVDLKDNFEYNEALIDKQLYLRIFDDNHRKYLRAMKDKEDKNLLGQMEALIEQKEETLIELNKQIEEGVEEKKPSGIN